MKVLVNEESRNIRNKYIENFLNTSVNDYENGRVICNGYFWEDFKSKNLISENDCLEFIKNNKEVYVLWDIYLIHEFANDSSYQYPMEGVILLSTQEFFDNLNEFPEDIYIFDKSYSWTITLTHETNLDNSRFCLIQK